MKRFPSVQIKHILAGGRGDALAAKEGLRSIEHMADAARLRSKWAEVSRFRGSQVNVCLGANL
jgi:hypothetical protein